MTDSEERHFSHSSLATWRRCKARYKWTYVDNYTTPPSVGQTRGSAGHAALAEWYRTFNVDLAIEKAAAIYNEREIKTGENLMEDWDLLELILKRYFRWSEENDEFDKVIALEQKFEFQLNGHTVIGYIDGVVQSGESLWLLENKFNKKVDTKALDIDAQVSLYMLACYKLGIDVRGVLYNIVRVAEGGIAAKEPVVRRKVYRNQEGLAMIEAETAVQLAEMSAYHKKNWPVYRNPTSNCSWDCGFYGVCLAINDDGDINTALSIIPKSVFIPELKGDLSE